jgi:hypothetical protein
MKGPIMLVHEDPNIRTIWDKGSGQMVQIKLGDEDKKFRLSNEKWPTLDTAKNDFIASVATWRDWSDERPSWV